jgi:hypothetical protein
MANQIKCLVPAKIGSKKCTGSKGPLYYSAKLGEVKDPTRSMHPYGVACKACLDRMGAQPGAQVPGT